MRLLSDWPGMRAAHRTMWMLSFCLLAGCSSLTAKREQQDIVEAELRSQERHINELKAELERKEGTIHGLDLEVEKLQQAAAGAKPSGEPIPPGVVKEITLGRLTGGYRANPKSLYDDSLQFLVEPKDVDGHAIKAPGSLHIELFEITSAGLKVPLSAWDITHREMRRSWDQPLFGSPSYRILIPFKTLPANERMRVVIRFTTLDGKPYEAEKDFSIRLPGPGAAPMVPMNAVPGGYSVVTPGRMINGTLVGPMNPPAATLQTAPATLPAPSGMEGTGRIQEPAKQEPAKSQPAREKEPEKKQEAPPSPPMLEPAKPAEKKNDSIPVIPLSPRPTPASLEQKGDVPPPLPPPPSVPQFDKHSGNYEMLPSPSDQPRSSQPLYPRDTGIVQAGYESNEQTSLTQPPPASWRTRHLPAPIVEYSGESAIKLSRPVIVK